MLLETIASRPIPQVVFVDDDEEFIGQMKDWQREVGIKPLATTDPKVGLDWVGRGEGHRLVSDLRMPQSGLTLIKKARRLRPSLEAYVLSGYDLSEAEEQTARELGVDIFSKVEHLDDLLAILRKPAQEDLDRSIEDLKGQVRHLLDRVKLLEEFHGEWTADLVNSLECIPDRESARVYSSAGDFTVDELLSDIRNLTPRGREHIALWRRTVAMLIGLDRSREG